MPNEKFTSEDLEKLIKHYDEIKIPSVNDDILKELRSMENNLIVRVLSNFLGRVPTLDDARLTCRVFPYESDGLYYCLSYNGVILGKVKYEYPAMELNPTVRVSMRFVFVPDIQLAQHRLTKISKPKQ